MTPALYSSAKMPPDRALEPLFLHDLECQKSQNYEFWNRLTQTFKQSELTYLVLKPGDIKSPLEDSCQGLLTN